MNVGLIGYGTIGRVLAEAIQSGVVGNMRLAAVNDIRDLPSASPGSEEALYTTDFDTFLAADIELVIEAASQSVLREFGPRVLAGKKHLMAMSVGAFADRGFLESMRNLALQHDRLIYLPAGAIGGLDILAAASVAEVEEVLLTTTKPPHSLRTASGEQPVNADTLRQPVCVFDGYATEAVRMFPTNVNVAAALSLAGIGPDRTRVRIVADPAATHNQHHVDVRGRFGELTLKLYLLPSPENPRTSYLAALSAISVLQRIGDPIRIG